MPAPPARYPPRCPAPIWNGGARPRFGASAIARIPRIPRRQSATRRRCAPAASARRPWPCWNRPRSTSRTIGRRARRLRPRARRHRKFPPGARRARPRPYARSSGLAHSLGAGHRARSDGPPRRSAPLLSKRAADRAGRALGAVQSRIVLRAVEGTCRRPRRLCAGPMPAAEPMPRVRQNLALVVGLQGRFAGSREHRRAPICRRRRRRPMSLI